MVMLPQAQVNIIKQRKLFKLEEENYIHSIFIVNICNTIHSVYPPL